MAADKIVIKGARQNNLKNIDLEIPKGKLVVITGVSGSGKSSLAFDTLYAEGQRRYIESLSAYARQFLNPMDKPDVDLIEGLSPAISIDQKWAPRNPRSTVGTVTEIYDYLRLLFARIGVPHCPKCGREVSRQTPQQIVERLLELPEGTRIQVLAPVVRGRKGIYRKLFEEIRRQGFARVRVDGEVLHIEEAERLELDRYRKHDIEIVVDRVVIRPGVKSRLADSIETASKVGKGVVVIEEVDTGREHIFSERFSCPQCGVDLPEMEPRIFSFNSPYGACKTCDGLGVVMEFDPDLVIPDKNLSIAEGAIVPWRGRRSDYKRQVLKAVAEHYGFSIHTPIKDLTKKQLKVLLYGTDEPITVTYRTKFGRIRTVDVYFEGVINSLKWEYESAESDYIREELQKFMAANPCPACKGARLRPESLAVTVGGKNIYEVTQLTIRQCLNFFEELEGSLTERERAIAHQILKEIRQRLRFLMDVGLDYLTLDRAAQTLAGGEAQRIRLATQIGSGLTGVLYILDEPTIGLHPRDITRLVNTLKRLRDLGNTVIVVEHDETTIRSADWVIDLGPGAGEKGGRVVAQGPPEKVAECEESLTGQYLAGKREIPVPKRRRKPSGKWLVIKGARQFNLKNIEVRIPLGLFVCVTGVSGSGKSTLVYEILYKRLAHKLHGLRTNWGEHDEILGVEHIDKVICIDQS
ncbi:MAG TPA: excinuclease ABC subunit A, partial [Armatimonadetes bacterium]|nr:excinuclease ABC subunit A [Armatimonadota bacterium]